MLGALPNVFKIPVNSYEVTTFAFQLAVHIGFFDGCLYHAGKVKNSNEKKSFYTN